MAEQRKDSRSAASLKVKYKSATVDDFAQQFGTDVSRGGIFIKTKSPLEAGALLKLELQLSTAAAVISGIGRVAWRRAASLDPSRPAGMGIKFVKLEPASQVVVERIVQERGAGPSRFDQSEGAELARASLEPPAPTSLAPSSLAPGRVSSPDRISAPDDAPPTVRPPAPIEAPVAAIPNKPLAASRPLAGAALKPAAVAAPLASNSARIGPTKAAIPSGLFANSPLVQQPPPSVVPLEEKRTSFFPPAPAQQPAARGGSNASGQLSASRSSSGSVSSPLHRPLHSRAPSAAAHSRAPAAGPGPKGVFGGPAPASPFGSSSSGLMRPAKEIPGVSTPSLLPDRSADELPTAAVARPPAAARPASRVQPSSVAAQPSVLDSLVDDVFGEGEAELGGEASVDGMFATLEPLGGEAPPARGSRPSGSGPMADRASPAPTRGSQPNGRGRDSNPGTHRGLAAAEAADVDNLFADLEGDDDATTDEVKKPGPASAVFSPGSTRPSLPPGFDKLADDDRFGEADFLGDDPGSSPDDIDEDYEDALPSAAAAANEPPMLRLAEPTAQPEPEAKRPPARAIGIAIAVLVLIIVVIALAKPELIGLGSSTPAPQSEPAAPIGAAPTEPAAAQPSAPPTPEPAAAQQDPALPAGEMVSVNVTSLPRGADVRVGAVVVGTTPTHIDLPLGRDTLVTVGAQGHAAQSKTVAAARGMEPLRFKLEPLPYVLVVTTTPARAELTVGSVTGVSPAPLALGHISNGVDVAVSKDGYRRMTRQVRLEEFAEREGVLRAEIEITLSPMPGTTAEPAPSAAPSSSSSRRRNRNNARVPEAPLAPPEPDGEASMQAAAAPADQPAPAAEPTKAAGAPPPPPSLPALP